MFKNLSKKIFIAFAFAGLSAGISFAQKPSDFEQKAQQGDAEAQYRLGHCYGYGEGVKSDYPTAFKWYEKAVKQGHADATAALGSFYYYGVVVEKNYEKAVSLFREAEQKGSTLGQYWLGICYYSGNGVEKDLKTAFGWFQKAAEQGDAEAQNDLADCYYMGSGVTKDYVKAAYWYQKAAEQGHANAQYKLADCYITGKGVEYNRDTAVEWYRKAAKKGHAEAKDFITEENKRIKQWETAENNRIAKLKLLKKGDEIKGFNVNGGTIIGTVIEWNAKKNSILIKIAYAAHFKTIDGILIDELGAEYKGKTVGSNSTIWISNLYNKDNVKDYVWKKYSRTDEY